MSPAVSKPALTSTPKRTLNSIPKQSPVCGADLLVKSLEAKESNSSRCFRGKDR